jgi:hypothetical protein
MYFVGRRQIAAALAQAAVGNAAGTPASVVRTSG